MKFEVLFFNELPYVLEIPDGDYEITTKTGPITLTVSSEKYKLHRAPFAQYAGKYTIVADEKTLQEIIVQEKLSNYAFDNCKTFISCVVAKEKDITDDDIEAITEEQCVNRIQTILLRKKAEHSGGDMKEAAKEEFNKMLPQQIIDIKKNICYDKTFQEINCIYDYYEALNSLIKQYRFLRKHIWVYKLDENILEGTSIVCLLNGQEFNSFKFAGLVPSILPFKKKYPELSAEETAVYKQRLLQQFEIPISDELLLAARGLWYRLEYRSAIIESSAALEVAVEKKLIEKMTSQGMNDADIRIELAKTETNFNQRCDVFLKRYTGQSFVVDNATLWNKIDIHRKNYRHKIAHSDVKPDKKKTEEIINDFESAVRYIAAL